jgi:DNA (cytosine-5)-methyltransferase 1
MAGMECSWMVEVDKFGSQILKHQWPEAKIYGDIYTIDGKELEPVDLICGGFPCQPVSVAGKRGGTSDERWLWGEFARIIRQVKPRWVVAENVTGLLSANSGRAFAEVLRDLAQGGYDAVWDVYPAGGPGGVGAPHRRERIFIVAKKIANSNDKWVGRGKRCTLEKDRGNSNRVHSKMANTDRERSSAPFQRSSKSSRQQESTSKVSRESNAVADTKGKRHGRRTGKKRRITKRELQQEKQGRSKVGSEVKGRSRTHGDVADTNSKRGRSRNAKRENAENVGQSSRCKIDGQWDVEPNVGRVANGVSNRVDRLRALGNAVVPQVAKQIGEMIMEIESV